MASTTTNYGFPYPQDPDPVDVAGDLQGLAEDIDNKLGEIVSDTVGLMVNSNTENGISVTYDDSDNTLDFDVEDFDLTFLGDVSGSASIVNLASASATITIIDDSHNHSSSTISDFESAVQSVTDSFVTLDLPSGTDPIATEYNDTLTITQSNGIVVNGSGSNTVDISTDATSDNTPLTIVQRDDVGGFDINSIAFNTSSAPFFASAGYISWSNEDQTLNIGLESGVVLKSGQVSNVYVKNETGSTILKSKAVYVSGAGETVAGHPGHPFITEFVADGSINGADFIGLAAHDIDDGEHGYVTSFGPVRNINTSSYAAGTVLYASSASAGFLTDTKPNSPDLTVIVGIVAESGITSGSIFVNPRVYPTSDLVTYDNSDADISSTNVKGALDELSLGKADVSALASNINLYPTSASSMDIGGYFLMVSDIEDSNYDSTAVDVGTGAISGNDQLIASLVSASGLIVGNPGVINVSIVGNIAKTAGNKNNYAEFYFKIFHRNSSGTETLLGTSDTTGALNPDDLDTYFEFNDSALTNFITFVESDRIVIKYYANALSGVASEYDFQFGGTSPVRTLLPVPAFVIPIADASGIIVDTSTFNGNLSGSDTTVQAALETLDTLDALPSQPGNSGKYLTTDGTNASWDTIDLGSDTSGIYVAHISGTANEIEISGSGTESASVVVGLPNDVTIANDLTVSGNLTVSGSTTYINTTELLIEDNLVTLNSGTSGSPTLNAGIEIDRGDLTNTALRWNESSDVWQFTNDGSTYYDIVDFDTTFATKTTDDLTEGSNLYFTNTRALDATEATIASASAAAVLSASAYTDSEIAALTTDDIAEASNLYFTTERAQDAAADMIVNGSHTNIIVTYNDGTNTLDLTGSATVTDEQVQDAIAPLFTHAFHTNITATYDDANDRIVLVGSAAGGGGSAISTNVALSNSWWLGV